MRGESVVDEVKGERGGGGGGGGEGVFKLQISNLISQEAGRLSVNN